MKKFQKNNRRKYKYNNSMTQFASLSFFFFFHQQAAGYSYYSCTVIIYSYEELGKTLWTQNQKDLRFSMGNLSAKIVNSSSSLNEIKF